MGGSLIPPSNPLKIQLSLSGLSILWEYDPPIFSNQSSLFSILSNQSNAAAVADNGAAGVTDNGIDISASPD